MTDELHIDSEGNWYPVKAPVIVCCDTTTEATEGRNDEADFV